MRRFITIFALAGAAVFYMALVAHMQVLASLWIPALMLLFLVGFPAAAVIGQNTLFRGLFELDLSPRYTLPIRLFLVTLAAFAVAGSAVCMTQLMLFNGPARFGIPNRPLWPWLAYWIQFGAHPPTGAFWRLASELSVLAAWVAGLAIFTSRRQDRRRSLWRMVAGAALGIAVGDLGVWGLMRSGTGWIHALAGATASYRIVHWLGTGYSGAAWAGNVAAALAAILTMALYAAVGWYGWKNLGKQKTVPALLAPLFSVLVLGWMGSALDFWLGAWHIPLLLVVAVLALINSVLPGSDHTYPMVERNSVAAPMPWVVLTAKGRKYAIVAAAAGGGIQSAAWTARVLEGLRELNGEAFDRALCCISSISGGSMGAACYVNWLKGSPGLATPFQAASSSSLDEVAWGLAWPDLWRVFFPWPFRNIDRALAMEQAWTGNALVADAPPNTSRPLQNRLSDWNAPAADGELPAIIMNSTMVEVGAPLLLGSSDVNADPTRISGGWKDGDQLHQIGERLMDIPVVRAARLSASFPYVSPVARPDQANSRPHMIDGGLYDNFGMATLTEWLDQALSATRQIERVLVLQISGFPSSSVDLPARTDGGWLQQLLAPATVLYNVRNAGQVSHRDIELNLLEQKWEDRGVRIEDVKFEFAPPLQNGRPMAPPLSWHLMPLEIAAIDGAWKNTPAVNAAKQRVLEFLESVPAEAPAMPGTTVPQSPTVPPSAEAPIA